MSEDLRTIRTENDPLLTDDATRIRTLQSSESTLENPERTSSGTTEKATNRSTEALHSPDTSATPISLLLGPPPKDCFSLVYMITFVQGIAIFLPVNMSITIAPSYYSKYWWTLNGTTTTPYETNFMTIISCSVNGITYGHISALVFIYCPACVPRKLQKMSGMLIALAFVLGTIIGLTSTPLLGMMVTEMG